MFLTSGTRLGVYEVLSAIGAGGMGEVYRARDTKLLRDVAVKVLPHLLAADADRLARFEREAQVLAAFNHPNIAQVYGLEDSDGVRALVMELVDGQTLSDILSAEGARGLPLARAWQIAGQIAEALAAAHERGIVHRDLKPANVIVKSDGTVKVLDFGLAKAFGSESIDAMNSPTMAHATEAGLILGTAAYMSPEQARGKPVDERCDIWAFGVVALRDADGAVVLRERNGLGHDRRRADDRSGLDARAAAGAPSVEALPRKGPDAPAPRNRRRAVHDRRRPDRRGARTSEAEMDSLGSCRSAGRGAGSVARAPEAGT